jgi:hypothetical protein
MRVDQFPRPRDDTSIGFHYVGDTSHYDRESLRYWLGELKELGASWLVLPSTLDNPVPEFFLRELIAAHVEPVIRVDVWPIQPIDRSRLMSVCHAYAECGAYYLYVYSEPNLATQWRIEDWTAPGLVERFAGMLFPAIETIDQAGLFPLISPLAPGGHYWDLTFLSTLLGLLTRDKRNSLRERLGLCIHNYAGNRPLTWGKGGPERWPLVRPYDCPSGSQDHRGFYLFEWYDAIAREHLGQSLPMICGETGLVPGAQDDPSFPAVDDMTHSMRSVEMARMLMDGELPDYVFNTAFWTLAAGDHEPTDAHAWYRRDTSTLPAVRALKELKKRQRRFSWDESPDETKSGRNTRPIYHYVLFQALDSTPGPSGSATRWMLPAALDYVGHFRPTVGFSAEEARRASRVTIVGNDPQRTSSVEASLRDSGCLVETIQADSEEELKTALDDLIRRGRRFRKLPG